MTRQLRAGRLVADYENGDLRYIRIGRAEVVRRIYMAVRDRDWNTIPARLVREDVRVQPDSFEVAFEAEHRDGDIVFRWAGLFRGSADRIEVHMDGEALSSFWKNRIGFCVLHPGEAFANRECTVRHSDGSEERGRFPEGVSPHQLFLDIRSISYDAGYGGTATMSFEGDTFEMEDQRNWTDDSFKTYSTPLAAPFPVRVEPGFRVRQKISVEVSGGQAEIEDPKGDPIIQLESSPERRFPLLGLGDTGRELSAAAVERLHRLNLSHLRVDLRPSRDDWRASLEIAAKNAASIGSGLEIAAHIASPRDLTLLEHAAAGRLVNRWHVYDLNRPATTRETVAAAREILQRPVVAGTDANFAEVNRNRDGAIGADAVCFSINPQVHGDDELTIVETLRGQAAAVRAARAFSRDLPVIVSPVTLRPRFNAVATSGEATAAAADPRQKQPFTAAWTTGSIANLANAGAAAVTYFQTTGPDGLMDEDGTPYPVYELFKMIGEFKPERIFGASSSSPLEVVALGLARRSGERRFILANLTAAPIEALVHPEEISERVHLEPYAVVCLDR